MSGVVIASLGTSAGGVALSVVIENGESASNFENPDWTFSQNTATVSGGTPPYTYSWAWTGTSAGTFGFSGSSTVATVTPTVSNVSTFTTARGTLTCTVTDAAATVVASNTALYEYENFSFGPPP